MAVLAAARLLCVLIGQLLDYEGGTFLGELVSVGLEALGARQLQKLLSELGRVSLDGATQTGMG